MALALCAYLLLSQVAPEVTYEPRGMAIPKNGLVVSDAQRSSAPVLIYQHVPYGAELLGEVVVEYTMPELNTVTKMKLRNYATSLAKQLGGNALIIEGYGRKGDVVLLKGQAFAL